MKNFNFVLRILAVWCCFFAFESKASIADGLLLEPFLTIEYSAPNVSSGGVNTDFQTKVFESQLGNVENIALGGHFRIHKFFGLNVNWTQTSLYNEVGLQDYSIAQKANFKMDYFNFSALAFLPVVEDSLFELFAEAGVADMQTSLSVLQTNGQFLSVKDHQTNPFFGGGFQIAPFEEKKDAIRVSAIRYVDKISVLDTDFTVIRIGYVKRF